MPLKNTLNVSELLKRLGVVGDSQASAELLDQIRLNIQIADLSNLVPPVGVAVGGARGDSLAGTNQFGRWTLQSASPGGLTVQHLTMDMVAEDLDIWITDTNPINDPRVVSVNQNFGFGQTLESIFTSWDMITSKIAPADAIRLFGNGSEGFDHIMPLGNWIGPGQFFNIESVQTNRLQDINITWLEYPGAINP